MKKILITGGNSGLGFEIVKLHHNFGDNVFSVDLNHSHDFYRRNQNNLTLINMDLTNTDELSNLNELVLNADIIYLNAGAATKEPFNLKSESKILQEIQLNIISNVIIIRKYLQSQKHGKKLVVISSSVRYFLSPELEIYAASKNFISSFLENLFDFTKNHKINLYLFEPSGMRTNFQKKAGVNSSKNNLLDPFKVAKKIVNIVNNNHGFVSKRIGLVSHLTFALKKVAPYQFYFSFINFIFKKFR